MNFILIFNLKFSFVSDKKRVLKTPQKSYYQEFHNLIIFKLKIVHIHNIYLSQFLFIYVILLIYLSIYLSYLMTIIN